MRNPHLVRPALILALALHALGAGAARAQAPSPARPWARFEVPDSSLKAALFANASEFEGAWNALLVAELRAISGSKSALVTEEAARLLGLARRIAKAESAMRRSSSISAGCPRSATCAWTPRWPSRWRWWPRVCASSTVPKASSARHSPCTAGSASGGARRGWSAASEA